MQKVAALFMVFIGLLLAVILPVILSVSFNFPGAVGVGAIMPGLALAVSGIKLWRKGDAPNLGTVPILPGQRMCAYCKKVVEETQGVERQLDPMPMQPAAKKSFVCHSCESYLKQRSVVVLLLLLVPVGACLLGALFFGSTTNKKK